MSRYDNIDTRDLLERLEELQAMRDLISSLADEYKDAETDEEREEIEGKLDSAKDDFDKAEQEELAQLEELQSDIGETTFRDGCQLIHPDNFTDAMRELCEDIGDVPRDLPHYIAIDWDETAENLKVDYSIVTFNGEDYLHRE